MVRYNKKLLRWECHPDYSLVPQTRIYKIDGKEFRIRAFVLERR